MIVRMHITAEPRGEFYLSRDEWMVKFPYPQGVSHYVNVPEPYQADAEAIPYHGTPVESDHRRGGWVPAKGHVPGACCTAGDCGSVWTRGDALVVHDHDRGY